MSIFIIFIVVLLLLLAGLLIYILAAGPALPPETDAIIAEVQNSELPELITGQSGFATANGLSIWYECISPPVSAKGVILLLMGMGGNALMWPPPFVRALLHAGYQVIRYDHRSTGMSDWVTEWDRKRPYTVADMAGDALAVLDALQVEKAHLIGLSMGGMIAQEVAIQQPERVASLTLLMTSGYVGDPELPGLSSTYFLTTFLKGLPLMKYRLLGGEKNLIKEVLAKTIAGGVYEELDIRETAVLVLYDLRRRRGVNLKSIWQHQTAVTVSGSRYEQLATLAVPTLVIHGTADPVFPVAHGQKLVATIPGATGVWLEGVGHMFPAPDMELLLARIFHHLEAAGSSD